MDDALERIKKILYAFVEGLLVSYNVLVVIIGVVFLLVVGFLFLLSKLLLGP